MSDPENNHETASESTGDEITNPENNTNTQQNVGNNFSVKSLVKSVENIIPGTSNNSAVERASPVTPSNSSSSGTDTESDASHTGRYCQTVAEEVVIVHGSPTLITQIYKEQQLELNISHSQNEQDGSQVAIDLVDHENYAIENIPQGPGCSSDGVQSETKNKCTFVPIAPVPLSGANNEAASDDNSMPELPMVYEEANEKWYDWSSSEAEMPPSRKRRMTSYTSMESLASGEESPRASTSMAAGAPHNLRSLKPRRKRFRRQKPLACRRRRKRARTSIMEGSKAKIPRSKSVNCAVEESDSQASSMDLDYDPGMLSSSQDSDSSSRARALKIINATLTLQIQLAEALNRTKPPGDPEDDMPCVGNERSPNAPVRGALDAIDNPDLPNVYVEWIREEPLDPPPDLVQIRNRPPRPPTPFNIYERASGSNAPDLLAPLHAPDLLAPTYAQNQPSASNSSNGNNLPEKRTRRRPQNRCPSCTGCDH